MQPPLLLFWSLPWAEWGQIIWSHTWIVPQGLLEVVFSFLDEQKIFSKLNTSLWNLWPHCVKVVSYSIMTRQVFYKKKNATWLPNSFLILTASNFWRFYVRSGVAEINKINWIESASLQLSKKTKIGKSHLERRFSAYFSCSYTGIVKMKVLRLQRPPILKSQNCPSIL